MVIDRHIRCIRVVNNNRYMYRKISSHARIHIKFCYLIAKTLHSCRYMYTHPTNRAHTFECCALFRIRGITQHLSLTSKDERFVTLYYRERRKHFIIPLIYAYNNRVGNNFTPATDSICRLLEEAFDRDQSWSSNLQFSLARAKMFLRNNT